MTDKLSTQPYRGTRDFLPEEMSVRLQVFDRLYRAVESFGYVRYDGPLLEPVEMYEAKSGQELVNEQLYTLTDRGERRLALRPEMTPTVARLIAANRGKLSFPVRWYSHPNCFRYERPQRGRVREHWQINVDLFGAESAEAEAEIFGVIHRMMRALGATPQDYLVRVSDRALVQTAMQSHARIPDALVRGVFQITDRWEKVDLETSRQSLRELGLDEEQVARIVDLVGRDLDGICALVPAETVAASRVVTAIRAGLVDGPVRFDPLITRGFDYYTSTVFEVFDVSAENRRALFGGGRYDNLVALFSDERIAGIGFGMGDVTLINFLETHGLLPAPRVAPDVELLVGDGEGLRVAARPVLAALRDAGLRVVTPLERRAIGKELKAAAKRGTRVVVMVQDEEWKRGAVVVRDLDRSVQSEVAAAEIAAAVRAILG
jgi:histidyl-tRNA synthetase